MAREIVPDALLEVLGPLLPAPRMPPHGGRPPVPQRAALTGTSFVCPRRASRGSNCPSRWAGAASSRAGGDSATGKLSVFMDLPPQQPLPASAWADLEGPPRCWLPALGRTWHPQKVLPAIAWPDLAPPKSAARHRLAGPGTPKKVLPVTGWPDLAPPKSAARHRFRGDDQNDRHSTSGSVCHLGVHGPRPDEGIRAPCAGSDLYLVLGGLTKHLPIAFGAASRPPPPTGHAARRNNAWLRGYPVALTRPGADWTCSAQEQRVARTPLASQRRQEDVLQPALRPPPPTGAASAVDPKDPSARPVMAGHALHGLIARIDAREIVRGQRS